MRLKNIVDVDQSKVVPMRIQRGLAWSGEVERYFQNFARNAKHSRISIQVNDYVYRHQNHQFMQLNNTDTPNKPCSPPNPKDSAFPNINWIIGKMLIICLKIEEAKILALRLYCQPSCYRR